MCKDRELLYRPTGGGACDGGGLPCKAARRSCISSEEGTGCIGALRAASRASISLSDGMDSIDNGQCTCMQNSQVKYYTGHMVCCLEMLHSLGLVSSLSFSSLATRAWSSLLKPLVGIFLAMSFLFCPCLAGWWHCWACFASSAATRL